MEGSPGNTPYENDETIDIKEIQSDVIQKKCSRNSPDIAVKYPFTNFYYKYNDKMHHILGYLESYDNILSKKYENITVTFIFNDRTKVDFNNTIDGNKSIDLYSTIDDYQYILMNWRDYNIIREMYGRYLINLYKLMYTSTKDICTGSISSLLKYIEMTDAKPDEFDKITINTIFDKEFENKEKYIAGKKILREDSIESRNGTKKLPLFKYQLIPRKDILKYDRLVYKDITRVITWLDNKLNAVPKQINSVITIDNIFDKLQEISPKLSTEQKINAITIIISGGELPDSDNDSDNNESYSSDYNDN